MVSTPTLWDQPVARTRDLPTAKAAGLAAAERRTENQERVLAVLRSHPEGLTDEQTGALLDMDKTTAGKRRLELERMGLVEMTDETRPTKRNRSATVWKAVVAS